MESIHRTVLLNEAIEGLNLTNKSVVIDGTFGGGGHSLEICKRFPNVKIIAIDQDASAWKRAKDKFQNLDCEISFINANFRNLDNLGAELPNSGVDGIILDLGLSSDQLESSDRGFSFLKNEPLLMTMKENPGPEDITAEEIVNKWDENNLADIIYGYGEEKQARPIARAIVEFRKKEQIKTTFDLVKIIEDAIPARFRRGKIHYATKTFQAIRIAVNDELGALQEGLKAGFRLLKPNGRMSVISFHSLEDRIVKRFYKMKEVEGEAKIFTKKPITVSVKEIKNNPRSRSAKLRILQKS